MMANTIKKESPQIIYLPVDLTNPASPVNDLFKNFVRSLADEIITDLKQNKEPELKLVTREEAAKILRVCPDTISAYEQKGLIKNHSTSPRKKLYAVHELNASGITKFKKVS